jgi:hypothetical protein
MKKLILVLLISFLSFPVFAGGLSNSYGQKIRETVSEYNPVNQKSCQTYPNTPWGDVDRGENVFDLELEVRFGLAETPGGDRLDFYFPGNLEATVVHNLSPRAFWYGTLGQRSYQINQSLDAVYDEKFNIKYGFVGAGFYLFQTLKAYFGWGKLIEATDSDGKDVSDLGMMTEVGLQFNQPWAGNYLFAGVKWVRVASDKEEIPTAAENDGNPSHVGGFVGISFPLSR